MSPQDESPPLHQEQTPSPACQALTSPQDTLGRGEWAGGGKLEIEDREELQLVLISALCTRHTQPGTRTGQRIRRNEHICYQSEDKNIFLPTQNGV